MACARPQGSAARSRSREQGASPFAHVPRSLAPPATSPRRSPQLRFVPADPVAHVVRKAQEVCSLAPKDEPFAREAANGAVPSSLTCLIRWVIRFYPARETKMGIGIGMGMGTGMGMGVGVGVGLGVGLQKGLGLGVGLHMGYGLGVQMGLGLGLGWNSSCSTLGAEWSKEAHKPLARII